MIDVPRTYPCSSPETDDVLFLMHERIRAIATSGGPDALQDLLTTDCDLLRSDGVECNSWPEYQGKYLGIYGAFFYFYDSNIDRIRLINSKKKDSHSLNPPTLDVQLGKWFIDAERHDETMECLRRERQGKRPNDREDEGYVEFYRMFLPSDGFRRFTAAEKKLNVLLCPDGEVGFFVLEYILRKQFQRHFSIEGLKSEIDSRILQIDEVSAERWLESQFLTEQPENMIRDISEKQLCCDDSAKLTERLAAYGLLDSHGDATERTWMVFEWLDLQRNFETMGDLRFNELNSGSSWFRTWLPSDSLVEHCRSYGALATFHLIAQILIVSRSRRRSDHAVNAMARFFLPSHMTYRYRDSGSAKTVFAAPLGNVTNSRQSVAFVVGAIHLDSEPSQRQFWDGLSLKNRRSLSSALTMLSILGETVESGLREDAAKAAADRTAHEQFIDASVRTFSIITHETKSLFLKHFINIRNRLEVAARNENKLAAETCYAWDRMAASTSVAHLFSKVVALRNSKQTSQKQRNKAIRQVHTHFLEPLARMYLEGRLENGLWWVAANVVRRELHNPTIKLMPFSDETPNNSKEDSELSPEEFAHCYMIVTEPLRNFLNHGRDAIGEWTVLVGDEEVIVTLQHQLNKRIRTKPESQTFASLGEFLGVLPGCAAKSRILEDVYGRKGVEWKVSIGGITWRKALVDSM